jgi:acyl-CoA thioesterase YciA
MTDKTAADSDCPRDPILRVVPARRHQRQRPYLRRLGADQMDIAGGIVAGRVAQGAVATVAIETMEFIAPILLRDIISSMRMSSGVDVRRWRSGSRS